jgi:hypothetical protein
MRTHRELYSGSFQNTPPLPDLSPSAFGSSERNMAKRIREEQASQQEQQQQIQQETLMQHAHYQASSHRQNAYQGSPTSQLMMGPLQPPSTLIYRGHTSPAPPRTLRQQSFWEEPQQHAQQQKQQLSQNLRYRQQEAQRQYAMRFQAHAQQKHQVESLATSSIAAHQRYQTGQIPDQIPGAMPGPGEITGSGMHQQVQKQVFSHHEVEVSRMYENAMQVGNAHTGDSLMSKDIRKQQRLPYQMTNTSNLKVAGTRLLGSSIYKDRSSTSASKVEKHRTLISKSKASSLVTSIYTPSMSSCHDFYTISQDSTKLSTRHRLTALERGNRSTWIKPSE